MKIRIFIRNTKLSTHGKMDDYSDSEWNWQFYNELVEDVEENKNIIQCICSELIKINVSDVPLCVNCI